MSFVVYNKETTHSVRTYQREHFAVRLVEKLNKREGRHGDRYAYTDPDTYELHVVKQKTVRNLMSGKEVTIPSNTPRCCDPSSELYWTM